MTTGYRLENFEAYQLRNIAGQLAGLARRIDKDCALFADGSAYFRTRLDCMTPRDVTELGTAVRTLQALHRLATEAVEHQKLLATTPAFRKRRPKLAARTSKQIGRNRRFSDRVGKAR